MQIDVVKVAEIIGACSVILGVIIGLLSLVDTKLNMECKKRYNDKKKTA